MHSCCHSSCTYGWQLVGGSQCGDDVLSLLCFGLVPLWRPWSSLPQCTRRRHLLPAFRPCQLTLVPWRGSLGCLVGAALLESVEVPSVSVKSRHGWFTAFWAAPFLPMLAGDLSTLPGFRALVAWWPNHFVRDVLWRGRLNMTPLLVLVVLLLSFAVWV